MKIQLPLLLAALVALPAAGCFVTTDDPPPSRTVVVDPTQPAAQDGTLVVTWTIAGLSDPNECIKSQAETIEISIIGSSGSEVAAFQQTCSVFRTSIALAPGSYSAYAVLLDRNGSTRTTDASIAPFSLRGGESLVVPVDFPSDSFR
jgi:hypothetical protein